VIDQTEPAIHRVLEAASRKGVALEIRFLPVGTRNPGQVAAVVEAELGQIVKSVVFVSPRPAARLIPIVCLTSGCNEIDLALLAAVTGEFAIRAATDREVLELTGCAIDAAPPFGYGPEVRILMDQDLCQYQWIWAATGTQTAVFRVAPRTLRALANAVVAPIAAVRWMSSASGAVAPGLTFGAG